MNTQTESTTLDDVALLRAARRDPEAFGDFYRQNAERLYRWLLRATGDVQAGADLTGETFAAALAGLDGFRGRSQGSGVAWLFGIARNLLRRWHHDRRVETFARIRLGMTVPTWVPPEVEAVDSRLDAAMLSAELDRAFDDLPAGQRDALRLHVLEGHSHAEVAEQLGISESNARLRVSVPLPTEAQQTADYRSLISEVFGGRTLTNDEETVYLAIFASRRTESAP